MGDSFYNCWSGDPHFTCSASAKALKPRSKPLKPEDDKTRNLQTPIGLNGPKPDTLMATMGTGDSMHSFRLLAYTCIVCACVPVSVCIDTYLRSHCMWRDAYWIALEAFLPSRRGLSASYTAPRP